MTKRKVDSTVTLTGSLFFWKESHIIASAYLGPEGWMVDTPTKPGTKLYPTLELAIRAMKAAAGVTVDLTSVVTVEPNTKQAGG